MATKIDDEIDEIAQDEEPRGGYDDLWKARERRDRDKKSAQDWAKKQGKGKIKEGLKKQFPKKYAGHTAKKAATETAKQATKQVGKQAAVRGTQAAAGSTIVGIPLAIAVEFATNEKLRNKTIQIVAAIIVAFVLLIVLFFNPKNQARQRAGVTPTPVQSTDGGPDQEITIIGLTYDKTGPSQVNNGENIVYSIPVTYTGTSTIVLTDTIPPNTEFVSATGPCGTTCVSGTREVSWRINDPPAAASQTINETFTITLRPTANDILVVNTIVPREIGGSSSPPPGAGGNGGAAKCSAPSVGWCSPDALRPYFGANAEQAAIVCNAESAGDPRALNPNCNTGDYSVGLFQINLVAHCPGAYGPGRWGSISCDNLINRAKRDECEARWRNNPEENIKKAVEIFRGAGSTWASNWGGARACGVR